MGAMGLPGDMSSSSRFVRAAFNKMNAVSGESEEESVSQFFHILGSVEQLRGCVKVKDAYEITIYSSCCNADKGIYYYSTYENSQIIGVDMYQENLDGDMLRSYSLLDRQPLKIQNR
ncbi:MAG: linear amide C-N hydrolase, partial [Lachnospiraceae bacterium]|nr:linear amide C-N hydrolase [Lachnospiraceae bacterium]